MRSIGELVHAVIASEKRSSDSLYVRAVELAVREEASSITPGTRVRKRLCCSTVGVACRPYERSQAMQRGQSNQPLGYA